MVRKKYSTKQIIVILCKMEILCGQGRSQEESARQCEIPLNTYYRWRKQHGGIDTSDAKRLKELKKENARLKRLVADLSLDNAILKDVNLKKLLSPVKRKAAVDFVTTFYSVSNRRSCRVLGINRNAYGYMPRFHPDEDDLRRQIIDLATNHRRWGYRKVCDVINAMRDKSDTYLPRVNHKRIERIWREEGLKVPKKSTRKKSIITDEGSCIRLRPEPRPNHIWSYDFVDDKTANGRKIRFLNIYDEGRHMCIASVPRRSWKDKAVIQALADAIILHGMPEYLQSDNGPEFTANEVKKWLKEAGVVTMFVEPGSPWQNGYVESFNARMRDEFLNGEIFGNMYEAEVLTKRWVKTYNEIRPHMSLRGRAPQTIIYPSIA